MKAIVAADRNWGIGYQNKLLVSIPADMRFFREMTMGKVIIVGRKTLESFPGGRPLPGRTNIVLTKNASYKVKGAIVVHSMEELEKELANYNPDDVFAAGGESVYRMLLPQTDTVYVTRIDHRFSADTFFPDLDGDPAFALAEESEEQTCFDLEYRFTTYRRR